MVAPEGAVTARGATVELHSTVQGVYRGRRNKAWVLFTP